MPWRLHQCPMATVSRALTERRAKGIDSLCAWGVQRWEIDSRKLPDLATLHAWLHSTHLCYATSRQVRACSFAVEPLCPCVHSCSDTLILGAGPDD